MTMGFPEKIKKNNTNIPIPECISTTIDLLQDQNCPLPGLSLQNIRTLLSFILNNNVFTFNSKFYHKFRCLAMGSRIAPKIALITLDRLERMMLANTSSFNIKIVKRYVYDSFVIIDK